MSEEIKQNKTKNPSKIYVVIFSFVISFMASHFSHFVVNSLVSRLKMLGQPPAGSDFELTTLINNRVGNRHKDDFETF